ncbi:MAG: hypothetical protein IKQ29_03550 [Bacilli bacterium]|nr:hypothetical protein [Bacilli bacterium]
MKSKIIYFIFLFLIFITITEAKIDLKKQNILETNSFNTLIESNEEILLLKDNTIIEKYDLNNNYITKKEYQSLYNSNITKYNNNYILTGIYNNKIQIYIIDNNLKTLNLYEINEIVNNNIKINTHIYDNEIYLLITNNNISINNKVYKINNNTIEEHNINEYTEEQLINIFKETYYLLKDTLEMHQDTYNKAIIYNNKIYYQNNNKIKIKDLTNNIETTKEIAYNINDITIIEEEILLLSDNNIIKYDLEMNYINELNINKETYNIKNFIKTSNKLYIVYQNELLSILDQYEFNYNIENNYQPYGTIDVIESAIPGDIVDINITTNSGYAISTIDIVDEKGTKIEIDNNKFTMPEGNVNINVIYTETVTNPETFDKIYIVLILTIVSLMLTIIVVRKILWIKIG